jgi:hypothetical protein
MDIMDGMDTMDFPFDGRMDWFKDVTCCTCVYSVHKDVSICVHDVHCVHRVPVH